jgi:DUF971 family protein
VATLKELKAAFPKAGDSFYVACADKDMTLDQARAAYSDKLEADLDVKTAEAEKLRADAAKANVQTSKHPNVQTGKSTVGVEPVADGGNADAGGEDATTAWNDALDKCCVKGMNRANAVVKLAIEQPKLHADYLDAYNAKHGRNVNRRS